jgi:hypothetical protein
VPPNYQQRADSPHNPAVVPTIQASLFFPPSLPSTYPVRLASLFLVFVSLFEKCSCLFVPGPDPCLVWEGSDATKSKFSGEVHHERNIKAAAGTRPGNLSDARMLAKPELDPETSATHVCSLGQPCRNSPSAPPAKFVKISVWDLKHRMTGPTIQGTISS